MSANLRNLSLAGLAIAAACFAISCDERESLPPESQPAEAAPADLPPDATKTMRIKLDDELLIPNLVFLIERDSSDPKWMMVTLATTQAGPTGIHAHFDSLERSRTLDELEARNIDMASGARLDMRGDGIFSPTAVYQPKLVSIRVKSYDDKTISGTISGEFYKHRVGMTMLKPDVVKGDGTFEAARVEK